MRYTQKCKKKFTKNRHYEKRYNFETKQNFWFEFDTTISKPVSALCWNFKRRAVRSGRASSSWISIICAKKKHFLFRKPYRKNQYLSRKCVFQKPHMTGLKLSTLAHSASLRVARNKWMKYTHKIIPEVSPRNIGPFLTSWCFYIYTMYLSILKLNLNHIYLKSMIIKNRVDDFNGIHKTFRNYIAVWLYRYYNCSVVCSGKLQ